MEVKIYGTNTIGTQPGGLLRQVVSLEGGLLIQVSLYICGWTFTIPPMLVIQRV